MPHSVGFERSRIDAAPLSVVIVGGGFAGAALAYHLLQRPSPLRITLIERGPQLGRGLAYSASSPLLRLNVPAARMSLDPDRPDSFVRFAGSEDEPSAFLARRSYGDYVQAQLEAARSGQPERLRVVQGEAVAIEAGEARLADGQRIRGDRIVLATGLAARSGDERWPEDVRARMIDAWDERACANLARGGKVLLVGAGLSALDVLTLLHAGGHRDEVVVLSRHGLLPRPHAAHSGSFTLPEQFQSAPARLGPLLRWGRALIAEAERSGVCWQHALDAIRPHLPRLWQQLSAHDRARFVRLVRPYWEVLRHRAPRDVLASVDARRTRGELQVLAGRVLDCSSVGSEVEVKLRLRNGSQRVERFAHVVRCVGPELGLDSSPLMAAVLRQGLARRDRAGIGIATLECGRLLDANGHPSAQLFALGQPCRASRWETTAVPELVRDAVALAELLTRDALTHTRQREREPTLSLEH